MGAQIMYIYIAWCSNGLSRELVNDGLHIEPDVDHV